MSAALVIDCSLTMTWLFADEATAQTSAILERLATEAAVVPALWFLEITNVLALAERKGRITPVESDGFVAALSKLEFEVDHDATSRAFEYLLPLCRKNHLTSYDAAYLDVALRRQLPLATLDTSLSKVARQLGVELLL